MGRPNKKQKLGRTSGSDILCIKASFTAHWFCSLMDYFTTSHLVVYSSFWSVCLAFCTCPVRPMTNPAWRGRCRDAPARWDTSPRPRNTTALNHAANWCLRSSQRGMAWPLAPLPKPVSPTSPEWYLKLALWSCFWSVITV